MIIIIIVLTAVQEKISIYKITLLVELNFQQIHNTVRDSIARPPITQNQYNMGKALAWSSLIALSEWVHYNADLE